jgi:hypothetical protein
MERLGWLVLGSLLMISLLVAGFWFDRHALEGDEPTYAAQAASLAWDFDLRWERADFDRFVAQWGGPPRGLMLQSGDGGRRLGFGKPFLYALVTAPFVRLSPLHGAAVANALLLALAAVLAALTLRSRLGGVAPWYVALFVFASVSFAYVYRLQADLFLLAATVCGFALAYGGQKTLRDQEVPAQIFGELSLEERLSSHPRWLRWMGAGALVAVAGACRPLYLILLLPALLTIAEGRRRSGFPALLAGALAVLLFTAGLQLWISGSWTPYGGERMAFDARSGYPDVDFPRSEWPQQLLLRGNRAWLGEAAPPLVFTPGLLGWNLLYGAVGRHVGLLPYFAPLLLIFASYRKQRGRWALVASAVVGLLGFLILRPFEFSGGVGAVGNRYFLPLYGALWFAAAKPARGLWPVLASALAILFLPPLWRHPSAPLESEAGEEYRWISGVAGRWLPYETTLASLPGVRSGLRGSLWVQPVGGAIWRTRDGGLRLFGGETGELLVGSSLPLPRILVDCDPEAPTRLETGGAELRPLLLRGDGSIVFRVALFKPSAVHPTEWSPDPVSFYRMTLRLPGARPVPIGLRLALERDLLERRDE